MAFCEGECKAVMYRKAWRLLHDSLRAENSLARQVHDLQAAADERLLLSRRKLQQFLLEQVGLST